MAVAEPYIPQPVVRGIRRSHPLRAVTGSLTVGEIAGLASFLALVVVAILAPLIAPHPPNVPVGEAFTPPFHAGAVLGTDEVGLDIFSRVLYGLRASIVAAFAVIASGVIFGGSIGLIAGVAGGWADNVLMRITDLFLALPGPVLAIAVVAAIGPSFSHTLLAVALVWWPFYARIVRAEIRALAARPHLEAARLAGASAPRRAFRHLLPGAVPAVIVTASLDISNLVVTLAALSFLGLGAPAPAPRARRDDRAASSTSSRSGGCRSCRGSPSSSSPSRRTSPAMRCARSSGTDDRSRDTFEPEGSTMITLLAKRLVSMVFILLALAAIIFTLQEMSHTDPVHAYLGANASKTAIAHEAKILGYDKPIAVQYLKYVDGLLHGDLQTSLRTRRPVSTDIAAYLPATVELSIFGLILALMLGSLMGFASAARWRGSALFRVVMLSGASAPAFLLALLGILFFSGDLHWLPATGDTGYSNIATGPTGMVVVDTIVHGQWGAAADGFDHLLLPGLCIALGPAVAIGRVLRSSLVQAMRSDYVRTARAKGLGERTVILRHALRNSANATLSMTGLQAGLMFAGVVVIETIFGWPGLGLYVSQSIPAADFPAIAGVTLILGVGYVVINTIVDIVQAIADR